MKRAAAIAVLSYMSLASGCVPDPGSAAGPSKVEVPRFAVVPVTAGGGGLDIPGRLDFKTYDGSQQVVHPDVLRTPESWGGNLLTAITPYPNSSSKYENPSLFQSMSGETWQESDGVKNPLATTRRGYLSDPDVVYDSTVDELRLYYREVVMSGKTHSADKIYYMKRKNGGKWSAPVLAITDRRKYVVSPSIVRGSGSWLMWEVDAGTTGCRAKQTSLIVRASTDGTSWASEIRTNFSQPGYVPWHVDVQWVPARNEYWALVAAYPTGARCTATSLFLATSRDGVEWTTYPSPVLAAGAVPQFSANVYRSSLLFDSDDAVTLWMSGARALPGKGKRTTLEWSAAVARTTTVALLARVSQSASLTANRSPSLATLIADSDVP